MYDNIALKYGFPGPNPFFDGKGRLKMQWRTANYGAGPEESMSMIYGPILPSNPEVVPSSTKTPSTPLGTIMLVLGAVAVSAWILLRGKE